MFDVSDISPLDSTAVITPQQQQAIDLAYACCKKVLTGAYDAHGIHAGETHFSDVWIRDACFSSWGALAMNDDAVVKHYLAHVLDHMSTDGQCPLRIGQKYFLLKYLHLRGPTGPTYIEDKYISVPVDSNSLVIILFLNYVLKTNDTDFLMSQYGSLERAMDWYDGQCKNGLIWEGPYAGWADSLKKTGHVLYSNVLYAQALHAMGVLSKYANQPTAADGYNAAHSRVCGAIESVFWNGTHLNDWVDGDRVNDRLSLDGNALAILFNIVDDTKQQDIIRAIFNRGMVTPHGCALMDKPYDWRDIYPPFLLIGLSDYHNGLIWFWVSCIYAVALIKHKEWAAGVSLLEIMAMHINRDNTVYEVYTPNGQPVNRWVYKSEKGFAWSSGLFVWAYNAFWPTTPK